VPTAASNLAKTEDALDEIAEEIVEGMQD